MLPLFSSVLSRDEWVDTLMDAFANRKQTSNFLPLAEEALGAFPADAAMLCIAATAALLDGHSDRAMVFLKRLSRRYEPTEADPLLLALALKQRGRIAAARQLLERHGMTTAHTALRGFPGGLERIHWLSQQIDAIMGRDPMLHGWRGRAAGGGKTAKRRAPKAKQPPLKPKPAPAAARPAAPVAEKNAGLPSLPRIDVDISFAADFDLAPLGQAAQLAPEQDGAWYGLRERFAHLGLAQGFDELLCLPHLRGLETLWHQVETVRKVLKQFRGRVLLADEVGLGKTIEAGMVLKEYLLRGMAERVLVLTPPRWSVNGARSWRPSSTFPAPQHMIRCCARTRVRSGTSRGIVASMATARRKEHARGPGAPNLRPRHRR